MQERTRKGCLSGVSWHPRPRRVGVLQEMPESDTFRHFWTLLMTFDTFFDTLLTLLGLFCPVLTPVLTLF